MTDQTYFLDHLGIWHAVKFLNEFRRQVRGRCRHDFALKNPPVAKRPPKDKYCLGCLGDEQLEKARTASPTGASSSNDVVVGSATRVAIQKSIVGQRSAFDAQVSKP